MKIAVATEQGKTISDHFGRSPYVAIFETENGKIINQSMRENTFTGHFRGHHEGQQHGEHLHGAGDPHDHNSAAEGLGDCRVVISHGMGRRAWEDLRARGIEMIAPDETEVEKAVLAHTPGAGHQKLMASDILFTPLSKSSKPPGSMPSSAQSSFFSTTERKDSPKRRFSL